MRAGRRLRIASIALAALALPGCTAMQKYNPLLLIDDPLPGRAEREATSSPAQPEKTAQLAEASQTAAREAETTQLAAAPAPAPTPSPAATPAPPAPLAMEPSAARPVLVASLEDDGALSASDEEEAEAPASAQRRPDASFIGPVLFEEEEDDEEGETQANAAPEEELALAAPPPAEPPAPGPAATPEPARLARTAASPPATPPAATSEIEEVEDEARMEQAANRLGLSVVSALPSPDTPREILPGASGSREYVRFSEYALAEMEEAGQRESALLLDPPSIDPAVKPCGDKPSAVLVDLDPASGLLPLVGEGRPDPALAGLLHGLRERGVTVFWISGHGPEAASAIRGILGETALDPTGEDPLILMRFAGESKQKRRVALADTHCLLAIAGDQRADFDELFDHVLDPVMAAPLEVLVGNGWFLAPPPIE